MNNQQPTNMISVPWVDAIVFAFIPLILSLSAISHDRISRGIISLIFILLLTKNLLLFPLTSYKNHIYLKISLSRIFSRKSPLANATYILILLLVFAEIRGAYTNVVPPTGFIGLTLWLLGIFFYALTTFQIAQTSKNRDLLLSCLVVGLAIFILLNFLGHAAGLQGSIDIDDYGPNKTLGILGIQTNRIIFPFVVGLNNFGIISGLCLIGGITWFQIKSGLTKKITGILIATIGLVGILLADTRGVILFGGAAIVLFSILKTKNQYSKYLQVLPYLLVLFPFIAYFTVSALEWSGIAQIMQRDGAFANKLGLASGRDAIWLATFNQFMDAELIQFIGYGTFGQLTSGLTKQYAWIFSKIDGQTNTTLHNATLQILVDLGYIGIITWLVFWKRLASALTALMNTEERNSMTLVATGIVFLIYFSGFTEVSGTLYQSEAFGLFLVAVAAVVSIELTVRSSNFSSEN